jgi:hypothetical protein
MSSPNFKHKKSCNCTTHSLEKPCYVWFHYPNGPGKIHRFLNINDAYKFAHDSTIDHVALPTLVDGDGKNAVDYDPKYLYNNDTVFCEVDWHNYLCDITTDINEKSHTSDHIWNISAGNDIQVSIGLGSSLPLSVSDKFCGVDPIYVNNQ